MIFAVGSTGSFSFFKELTSPDATPDGDGWMAWASSRSAARQTWGEPTSMPRQKEASTIQAGNSREVLLSSASTWTTDTPP